MTTLKRLALACALALGVAGCGDDDGGTVTIDSGPTPDSMVTPDAMVDAGPMTEDFPAYVIRLINTETRDNNLPDDHEARTLADPMSPTAFDALFP